MSVDTLGVQSLYRSGRHTISKNFGRFGVAGSAVERYGSADIDVNPLIGP
jgi:hypothetical protein